MESMSELLSKGLKNSDNLRDDGGNSNLHLKVRLDEDVSILQETALKYPHQLFILNKRGQTPLDIMIEDELEDAAMVAEEKQETLESEKVKVKPTGYSSKPFRPTKIMDESQMKQLVES